MRTKAAPFTLHRRKYTRAPCSCSSAANICRDQHPEISDQTIETSLCGVMPSTTPAAALRAPQLASLASRCSSWAKSTREHRARGFVIWGCTLDIRKLRDRVLAFEGCATDRCRGQGRQHRPTRRKQPLAHCHSAKGGQLYFVAGFSHIEFLSHFPWRESDDGGYRPTTGGRESETKFTPPQADGRTVRSGRSALTRAAAQLRSAVPQQSLLPHPRPAVFAFACSIATLPYRLTK